LLSALKLLYAKLTLIGGLVLVVGLLLPWYYQSTANGKYYEMNALGGSLVGFKEGELLLNPLFFDLLTAYFSMIFALLSILFPLVSVKLAEKSQRKWIGVVSLLGGVAALANIFYVHFWLGWYYPDGLLFYSDASGSRGPSLGYFLTWAAAVMLFASTYVSRGLVQAIPVKTEKAETKQIGQDC
jgi:hypothetical protein